MSQNEYHVLILWYYTNHWETSRELQKIITHSNMNMWKVKKFVPTFYFIFLKAEFYIDYFVLLNLCKQTTIKWNLKYLPISNRLRNQTWKIGCLQIRYISSTTVVSKEKKRIYLFSIFAVRFDGLQRIKNLLFYNGLA